MGKYINGETDYRNYLIEMEQQQEDTPKLDSIVTIIINQFRSRATQGKAKYGVDLDRNDLTLLEWIEHAKQEHMDAILYLEKIKQISLGYEEKKVF
jgi:hypothetical protein